MDWGNIMFLGFYSSSVNFGYKDQTEEIVPRTKWDQASCIKDQWFLLRMMAWKCETLNSLKVLKLGKKWKKKKEWDKAP